MIQEAERIKMLDTIIVLLASFVGTGLVIRLIKEYIELGKKKEDHEEDRK